MQFRLASACAALSLFAAACATGTVPAPVSGAAAQRRPAASAARLDATTALLRPGAADAITIAEARALFGPPDVERRDGAGAILVWTLPTCALTLGFANDRLRSVEPGPRRTDAAPPGLQACIAEARSRSPAT